MGRVPLRRVPAFFQILTDPINVTTLGVSGDQEVCVRAVAPGRSDTARCVA